MTRYKEPGDGAGKLRLAMLVVALAVVSIAVGAVYSLGLFGEKAPKVREPLQITLSSDRLDFGELHLNDVATRQLILRNDGEKPLTAEFLVRNSNLRVRPERLILHPGVGSRVIVELSGDRVGALEDELQVMVDEQDSGPLVVALAGRVQQDSADGEGALRASLERRQATARQGDSGAPAAPTSGDRRDSAPAAAENRAVRVADNSRQAAQAAQPSAAGSTAAVTSVSRQPAAGGDPTPSPAGGSDSGTAQPQSRSVRVTEYDPANAVPLASLADRPPVIPDQITEEEAANARRIPSKVPGADDGGELPEELPPEEPLGEDDDPDRSRDIDQRDDDNDPFVSPRLIISGVQSSVKVLGHSASFYPQTIDVLGTDMGGPLTLLAPIDFPTVPLAFGESMLFAQIGGGASGGWDPLTGNVALQVPVQAVDADGDAAPMQLVLTTGTAMERNESGNVVVMTGSPRDPRSGLLRLVGMVKIPVGYRNGGEQYLVHFEVLASLTFGTSISSSDPAPIGRIGG